MSATEEVERLMKRCQIGAGNGKGGIVRPNA